MTNTAVNGAATQTAAAKNLNPEIASSIRDFFLTTIAAEHMATRALIQRIPANKLDFEPIPGGKTMSELMWCIVHTEHNALAGICDGSFAPLPKTPEQKGSDAVLQWDHEHFAADFKRLLTLSGEDLLRPVQFGGTSLPAVQYLPMYTSLILQFRGELGLYLSLSAPQVEPATAVEPEKAARAVESELSEEELAGVVGGTDSTSSTILVLVNGVLTPEPASQFQSVTIATMTAAESAAAQAHIQAMLNPTIDGFGISSLFASDDPTVKQIEGYLVTAATAVVTLGAAGAILGSGAAAGVMAGNFAADLTAAGIVTDSAVTTAASGFFAGVSAVGYGAIPMLAGAARLARRVSLTP